MDIRREPSIHFDDISLKSPSFERQPNMNLRDFAKVNTPAIMFPYI